MNGIFQSILKNGKIRRENRFYRRWEHGKSHLRRDCEKGYSNDLSLVGFLNISLLGLVPYSDVYVSGPHLENLTNWKEKGANISNLNEETVKHANIIFICVKPHLFSKALESFHNLRAAVSGGQLDIRKKLFVSVMAGISIAKLETVCWLFTE